MAGEEALALALDDLLAAAVAILNDGAPVEAAPSKQFITHAGQAHDCDSLFVRGYTQPVEDPGTRCIVRLEGQLEVVLLRCWPTPTGRQTSVPAATISAAARQLAVDGHALLAGLAEQANGGTLFPSLPLVGCDAVAVGALSAVPALGGAAGWSIPVAVDL